MFKRFDPENDVSTSTQVKSSVQRSIKSRLIESHPNVNSELWDVLLLHHPSSSSNNKKESQLLQYKVGPHLLLYCCSNNGGEKKPCFFQARDGPILPTLRLVHRYDDCSFTRVTVDRGAIPFILGGANIMCPGLTNHGAHMPPSLKRGDGVVVYAQGKQYALAVGTMTLSTDDIRDKNKGVAIEVAHHLGDGLYQTNEIS